MSIILGGNHTYSPNKEIDKFKVVLGKGYWDNDFEINLEDLRNIVSDANISLFCTYYYTDGGWSSDYYYLGFPLDAAVSRDPYLFLTRYDEDYNYSDIFQYCIQFYLNLHFPSDLPVEPDTDVCCHIVLDIDGFNTIETIQLRGVYRTVIESLDADARNDSWYKFKYPNGAWNGINLAIGTYTEVQKNPDKFEFVEDGTVLMRWDDEDEEGEPIYDYDDRVVIRDRDKSNNIIFVNRDDTPFKVMTAPEIEDYTCTNPDTPREFECIIGWDDSAYCFYYDYIYTPSFRITVKDKFVDESGNEIEIQERQTDNVPEDEEYTYEALDPIPDGYKLVSDPTVTDTSTEDKEIIFIYQKIPQYTITVKDKFTSESGIEERTDTRKEDKVPEGKEYTYKALDPIPDGYKLVSDSTVTDTSTEDKEIIFIYQKIPSYTITVKDVFTNEAGVEENTAIRQEDKLYEGSSYHYSALSPVPEGYELVGSLDYAGKADRDMEIIFTYRKKIVLPNTYSMVVKDKYIDVDGNVIRIDERVNTALNAFEEYNFTAIDSVPEGYEVVGASGYAGKITSNTEIIFVYQKKPAEKPVTY